MKRLGSTPQQRGSLTGETCPDVIELEDGDFLVIGKRPFLEGYMLSELKDLGASIGPDETAIVIPRQVLIDAKKDIPDE